VRPDLDVAATLECEPELLPYLPEILQDVDELGSDPQRLIECLEVAYAADDIRDALDLCCGKGAISIALAERFGMRIEGLDAVDAFLESARAAAADAGVSELCRFASGDLCAAVSQPGSFDLVIFGSVGPILGGITKTVTRLMTPLRNRGWLLIDDSVLFPGAPVRSGFEAHAQLEETRRRIEMSGAEIVAVHSSDSDARGHDSDMRRIVRRAGALVERRPDLAALVARYVERQRAECAYLERWTRDVTWLLRKPPARET
jgi:SAM-dependent methyltransferase